MGPWPDPDTAVQLPVEELAMRLLRRVAESSPPAGRSNLIGLERQEHFDTYSRQPRPKVNHRAWEQKVSAAFDWLIANGLLVRDSSQSSDNWVMPSELADSTTRRSSAPGAAPSSGGSRRSPDPTRRPTLLVRGDPREQPVMVDRSMSPGANASMPLHSTRSTR
jgi:hypothetical protein